MDLQWHVRRGGGIGGVTRWGATGSAALLIAGGIFSVLGLCFLLVAGATTAWTEHFLSKSLPATGTVTALRTVADTQAHSESYAPVFSFVARDGQSYAVDSGSSSNPPGFAVGETVRVLYDPANPTDAKIDTFFQIWVLPIVFGILGGIFTLVGLTLLVVGRLTRRREKQEKNEWSITVTEPW